MLDDTPVPEGQFWHKGRHPEILGSTRKEMIEQAEAGKVSNDKIGQGEIDSYLMCYKDDTGKRKKLKPSRLVDAGVGFERNLKFGQLGELCAYWRRIISFR